MTDPGTPLVSNLFGPSRTTRPLTGYEPKPASEEKAQIAPFVRQAPGIPEPLGGVRPFNPDFLRTLLRQGPGGQLAPGGPSSSNTQIVPAMAVGAPQGLSPQERPEPDDRGQDAREDVQEEGLVLMGRPAPSTPIPLLGSFVVSSQAVIARWITRTIRQQQQTTAQQTEWQRELRRLQEREEQLQLDYQRQVETLAPRMCEEFRSYYENK